MRVKGLSWLGVGVDDFGSALSFFEDTLGLKRMAVDERGVAILEIADGQLLEIFGPGTKGAERTSPPVAAFEVDDVDAACAELRDRGIEMVGEIGRWNGFEWAYFRGPGGYLFSVKRTPPRGWEETS